MKCLACGRSLTKYAVSIPTKAGVVGWEPVCARAVTIRPTRTRFPVAEYRRPARAVPVDERQEALPFSVEAA